MAGPKKNPVAVASGGVSTGPYTGLEDEERNVVAGKDATAIRAVDRKVTDGLNLVHEQFRVIRQERLEDRQEFREFRKEVRQEFRDLREETRQDMTGLRAEFKAELKTGMTEVTGRLDRLEDAIRELTARVSTLLERSLGTRRLVWGVLGTLGLLVAGGVLRPVFDRAAAALLGG